MPGEAAPIPEPDRDANWAQVHVYPLPQSENVNMQWSSALSLL